MNDANRTWRPSRQNVWLTLLISAWTVLVGISTWMMYAYSFEGSFADLSGVVTRWPSDTAIVPTPGRPTLVLFLHPKCPCSRATLAELERIWVQNDEQSENSPKLIVVATVPADAPNDWLTTDTVEKAERLAGATLVVDADGREAQCFGAVTSGTVMWFDAQGKLQYAGGITSGRGHEGANVGRDCVEQLLHGQTPPARGLPAFGCRLCLPNPV
jgi:hypothetical protein